MWSFKNGVRVDLTVDAAVLVDMQPACVREIEEEHGTRTRLITAQKEVIRYCAAQDIPLIVLELIFGEATIDQLQAEIVRVPRHSKITKKDSDGFLSSNGKLSEATDAYPALLFMGIHASDCVARTARSAVNRGHTVITAPDLIADSYRVAAHEAWETKKWYRRSCIFVPSSASLVA